MPKRIIFCLSAALLFSAIGGPALAIDLCHGGDRAARKVTCLVDGDTGWEKGRKWRMEGIDTPETFHPACPREKQIGMAATKRLQTLMSHGYTLKDSGQKGYYHRELVKVILADSRDAGKVLIKEGLAQTWPNKGNIWCEGHHGSASGGS
jgi:micrococcal nuclease